MSDAVKKFKQIQGLALNAAKNGAKPEILAVIKYAPDGKVLELLRSGFVAHMGESRLQDAQTRWAKPEFAEYRKNITLHFLGHIQKNKTAKITALFDYIDSVDSPEIAAFINEKAISLGKKINVMLQLKLTGSPSQSGVNPADADALARAIRALPNLSLKGIMAIAPQAENAQDLRPVFKNAAQIFESILKEEEKQYLSLGMSGDFEVAVREGANLPRIGSSIFEENDNDN